MINLIRNELFKIFHKKGIYIIFGISIVITGLIAALNNIDLRSMAYNETIDHYSNMVSMYESGENEIDENYITYKTRLETLKIIDKKDKNMKYYSPEYHFIIAEIEPLYLSYFENLYLKEDLEVAEIIKQEIDKKVEDAYNFDWKKQINEEIENTKNNQCDDDEYCKKITEETLFLLNYRLENNIPYTYKPSSEFINDYLTNYTAYLPLEKDESKIKSRNDLLYKRELEYKVQTNRYKLDNKLIKDNYSYQDAQSTFVDSIGSVSLFVVICIVLVASSVVADEFNKGTIKQLLVRPYTRSKIIFSKLMAILITVMLFIILVSIGQSVVTGIFTGSFKTIIDPVVLYSYNTHTVFTTNIVLAGLLKYACILPEIIILTLFTILVSVLFTNNGVSTAVGIVTYATAGILDIYIDAKPIISYIPLVNWDFNMYLFGAIPQSEYMVLSKSIYISVSTIILLLISILLFFKHKDIKNQ